MKNIFGQIIENKYFYLIIFLTLSPLLFYPISSDIAIFIRAGKEIADGRLIYNDFIDLKPPGFYYLYSLIYLIFSDNIISLRIFDILVQTTTSILIFHYVKDIFTKKEAVISAIIYAVSYVCINYNQTMNSESFLGISLMIILLINKNEQNIKSTVLSGLIIGINAGFKFTFALLLPAYLIFLLSSINGNKKRKIFLILLSFFTFFLSFLITLSPLLNSTIYEGFHVVISYLKFHSANPPLNMDLIKFGIKETGRFLGDNYSILLTISLFTGLYQYLSKIDKKQYFLILVFFIFLLLSVFWERKFSIYHFSRLYTVFSIFSGIGLTLMFEKIVHIYKLKDLLSKFTIIFFVSFLIILSPLNRYAKSLIGIKHYITDKGKYFQFYEIPDDNLNLLKTYKETADYINTNAGKNNKCLVMAIGAGTINYYLNPNIVKSKFAHSLFYFGKFTNNQWYLEFKKEFESADYLIIQNNDNHPLLTTHNLTTKELLEEKTELNNYLADNFHKVNQINCFEIYRRNNQ